MKEKALIRIDNMLVEELKLTGSMRRTPHVTIDMSRGDYISTLLHEVSNNHLCDVCKTRIKSPCKVVIYNSITNERCKNYNCVISGNSIFCENRNHKYGRASEKMKELLGLVCSEECYNMFILGKEVK